MKRQKLIIATILLIIFSCKTENPKDFRTFSNSSELWEFKDKIKLEDAFDFANMIYKISIVDSTIKYNKTINRIALIDLLNRDSISFGVGEVNNKDIIEILKKSNSISEFDSKAFGYDGLLGDNSSEHYFRTLTKEIICQTYKIHIDEGSSSEDLFRLINSKYVVFDTEKEFNIDVLIEKLNRKHKTKFEGAMNKWQYFDKTIIKGKEFITLPFVDDIIDNVGYPSNLFIAFSTETNDKYYIYDDPRNKNDDWKYDNDQSEFGSHSLPTKNPKWILIE